MKSPQKARKREMSKQAMREETERLVKEALERKTLTVKQGKTRIDSKCRKCGALNRVSAAQGQVRVPYMFADGGGFAPNAHATGVRSLSRILGWRKWYLYPLARGLRKSDRMAPAAADRLAAAFVLCLAIAARRRAAGELPGRIHRSP